MSAWGTSTSSWWARSHAVASTDRDGRDVAAAERPVGAAVAFTSVPSAAPRPPSMRAGQVQHDADEADDEAAGHDDRDHHHEEAQQAPLSRTRGQLIW